MGIVSVIWGVLAIFGMLVALTPCLGALNWLNIPFSLIGIVFSVIAMSGEEPAKSQGIAGLIMCLIAIVVGAFRLIIGLGIV